MLSRERFKRAAKTNFFSEISKLFLKNFFSFQVIHVIHCTNGICCGRVTLPRETRSNLEFFQKGKRTHPVARLVIHMLFTRF